MQNLGQVTAPKDVATKEYVDHYGVCSTAAATAAKVVTISGVTELAEGITITVKFTKAQTYNGAPTLNVNSLGAANIRRLGGTNAARYEWQAGEVLTLTYDGTYWVIHDGGIASETYYGATKLVSSAISTSTSSALTPSSLNSLAETMIAGCEAYSTSKTYAVGDRVRYSAGIYECIVAIDTAEAWTAAHWQLMESLQEQIDGKVDTADYAPVTKTADMTQPVGKDANGQLWTSVQTTNVDAVYRARVQRAADKAAVDGYFAEWWAQVYADGSDKAALLDRWFGDVMTDDLMLGVKLPLFATSTATAGELIEDSAGLVCVPSTATVAGRDDFAKLPQMWVLEVSAERNADGTVSIYAIQHIDDLADVRSGAQHLCMVLTKNTYWREYTEDGYTYIKQSCTPFPGAALWQGANAQGVSYRFAAWPKYMAGWTDAARTTVGCGTGLAPCCNVSHTTGLAKWKARAGHYSGGSYKTQKWQQVMVALKYAVKGNSGTIEGCSNYNFEYAAAVSETGVERVLVTTAQAANLLVGSSVCIGARGSVAIRIARIETVEVGGATYGAVYVDNGGTTFNVVAGSTYLRTMPYYSGYNDDVLGVDGSRTNYTNGKEPGLIQGTEFMIGAWCILSDALLRCGQTDYDFTLNMYLCPDPSKAASSVTEDYVMLEGGTLTGRNPSSSWHCIQDMFPAPACWPAGLDGGASTSSGCRASLYVLRGSGFYAAFAGGNLNNAGNAGLAAVLVNTAPGYGYWNNALGSPSVTG